MKRIEEMLKSKDVEMQALGVRLQEIENIKSNLGIELAKKLLKEHQGVIVCGSAALFLHGVNLERWKRYKSDLDICMPYYQKIEGSEIVSEKYKSGRDFDFLIKVGDTHVDLRIDPKLFYEEIEMDDFKFKVAPIHIILEAKARYAMEGDIKHKCDLEEICGKKVKIEEAPTFGGSMW